MAARIPQAVADFLAARSVERGATEKDREVMDNIHSWPSHIPREPIVRLCEAFIGHPLPRPGFPPLSFRVLLAAGARLEQCTEARWKAGEVLLVLPRIAHAFQPAVSAAQVKDNAPTKHAIPWKKGYTRAATADEVASFLRAIS